jgi:hypothetical protein
MYLYELKTRVEKRANFLMELLSEGREIYLKKIEQYSERFKSIYGEMTMEFQLINEQIDRYVKWVNRWVRTSVPFGDF